MGIQGLLPLLKPIQTQRHLSEFAGQTLAVDAYVWLHRGAYACATELATGKPTTKYVDFSMHRVRLLRHYNILPYLVFDGGPLPAKQGTENDREKKRAENLKRGNALTAQRKHTQAREHYVKCVDVTPQMAFQVIKALRAENVPYVVAPYEADAQLAYLERSGLVDGIITEDSDLLVFGCKNVLFKLDIVSATITSIARSNFGSPALTSESISLVGWSDCQFRRMAMLSGCDYLPSIPGIGLKTAWTLLRKYKTVEKVVRALRLEGKKTVPRGYLDAFTLAEKVFLHQRVYDIGLEKLVHLMDYPDGQELDKDADAYVGKDLEPSLAKKIAEGDACPISFLPMEDINPSFMPNTVKSLPLKPQNQNTPTAGKGKEKEKAVPKGILSFFTPVSKSISTPSSQCPATHKSILAGRASGKRTLVDVMEDDVAARKRKLGSEMKRKRTTEMSNSRYFGDDIFAGDDYSASGPSWLVSPKEACKENVPVFDCDAFTAVEDVMDPVTQEDGYLSPSPSASRRLTPDFSSPVCRDGLKSGVRDDDDDFEVEAISSPIVSHITPRNAHRPKAQMDTPGDRVHSDARVLICESPTLTRETTSRRVGPDLQANFDDEASSEIGCWDEGPSQSQSQGTASSSSIPFTPPDLEMVVDEYSDDDGARFLDEEDVGQRAQAVAHARVADGWRARFMFGSSGTICEDARKPGPLRTVASTRRNSMAPTPKQTRSAAVKPRRSDPYPAKRPAPDQLEDNAVPKVAPRTLLTSSFVDEVVESAKGRLEAFRYAR